MTMLHCRLDLLFGQITAIVENQLHGNAAPDPGGRENSLGVIVGENRSFLFIFAKLAHALNAPYRSASEW